ncbi:MAG: nucleotidyltransferase family protein [Candidatus Harrisonbacteria bacterium]|nr:nucleotidyltransferase family protein [Candidatus Harrisonbacteria bacterium]
MKAFVFAAGKGTRMMPLTKERQKCMLPINGRPTVEHVLRALPQNIDEIILVVGYQKEEVQNYFKQNFEGKKIRYVVLEELRGTGQTLFSCKEHIGPEEKFLLVFGDNLYSAQALEQLSKEELALLAIRHSQPENFGVALTDERGYLLQIEEKPERAKSNLVLCGAYLLNGKIFNYHLVKNEETREYFLTELINQMKEDYSFKIVESNFWHPIGSAQDLVDAQQHING